MTDPIAEMRRRWDERWPDGEEAEAATQLMRVVQIIETRLDAVLQPFQLSLARYEALVLLSFTHDQQLPLSKLGERLMIHPASVTSIVDRLDKQRYVQRLAHPTDRRVILARITPTGLDVVHQATKGILEIRNGLEGFTSRDLTQLISLCAKFRAAAGNSSPSRRNGSKVASSR